jgi:hypothetical protein
MTRLLKIRDAGVHPEARWKKVFLRVRDKKPQGKTIWSRSDVIRSYRPAGGCGVPVC